MARTLPNIVGEVQQELQVAIYESLLDSRKADVTKRQFKKAYSRYTKKLSTFPVESLPLIHLVQRVSHANDLIGFTKRLAYRRNEFTIRPLNIGDGLIREAVDDYNRPALEEISGLLQLPEDKLLLGSSVTTSEIEGFRVRHILLPYVFISMWTALESYLHDRIEARLSTSRDSFSMFLEKIPVRKLPGSLRDVGEEIKVSDCFKRMPEIISQYLEFPYHDFGKKGKVRQVYKQCFGIDIVKYRDIGKLKRLAQLRHTIVHEGTTWFGFPLVPLEYRWSEKCASLILDFAEWIETEIATSNAVES